MKLGTQSELDEFFKRSLLNKDIYPYLSLTKYQKPIKVSEDNWNDLWFLSEDNNCIVHLIFDRIRDELSIGLWGFTTQSAAAGIRIIQEYIRRFKPRAINSVVHSSNYKSILLHNKIYGNHWGIEESAAWNAGTGSYEDALYYRKLL